MCIFFCTNGLKDDGHKSNSSRSQYEFSITNPIGHWRMMRDGQVENLSAVRKFWEILSTKFILDATKHLLVGNRAFDRFTRSAQCRYICLEDNSWRRLLFNYINLSKFSFSSFRCKLQPRILGKISDISSSLCKILNHRCIHKFVLLNHTDYCYGKRVFTFITRRVSPRYDFFVCLLSERFVGFGGSTVMG
ncbi:hypothetical protein Tcan_01354 [Toxocara canis]|uniref:Uncharacterized protein n=1 Tax=Toxocara canis TaxID=6265 RepID=A0A0B2V435_TOXCA|nr:hypothetical protein Tcan_01354 [Toxocara canis]